MTCSECAERRREMSEALLQAHVLKAAGLAIGGVAEIARKILLQKRGENVRSDPEG